MSVAAQVRALVAIIRHLLGCSQVYCMLYCPNITLRHPLLQFLSADSGDVGEPPEMLSLLEHEQVRVLLDLALQSGRMWCLNQTDISVGLHRIKSIAVAPIERPAGVAGFVFCLDTDPEAFLSGECQLIERFLPVAARYVERVLCDAYAPFSHFAASFQNEQAVSMGEEAGSEGLHEQMLFLSLVCHELRTPLAAIKGYAGLLQAYGIVEEAHEEEIAPALQQHYLDVIMEQTRQLEVLISDLLDLSRIQAGHLSLQPAPTDLARLCCETAQIMYLRLQQQEAGRYHIRCKIEDALPLALADPTRTRQVLINLLENAIKYSPDGGPIEIEVCRCSTHQAPGEVLAQALSITVRDQGIGIPSQQQSQLFKRFHRLERPATSDVPGYGLGLYISHQLVEAMGGRISLISGERAGTSITFTLPIFSSGAT